MKKIACLGVVAILLSGCSLAPDFKPPVFEGPEAFKEVSTEKLAGVWKVATPSASLPRGEWWRVFDDAALNALEDQAAAGNLPVQAMYARVQQARETANIRNASLFPSLNADAALTRQKPNTIPSGIGGNSNLPPQTAYSANLAMSYELDLFGQVRNSRAAARAEAESSQALLENMKLSLQADVATAYFNIRALDKEIGLLDRTLKLRQNGVDILKKRVAIGSITELDSAQATVDLENTRHELQVTKQQRKEQEHALALLLGKAPSAFTLQSGPLTKKIPQIPVSLPSALLERRPDISAAQQELAAANARIGIARAAFFPDISLTASGGLASHTLADLFQWSSRSWSIGPLLSLPVFSGGAATANARRSEHIYEESIANYRQQVLVAFKEVEDSLSRLQSLSDQAQSQKVAEEAAARARYLADKRYDTGDIGYLEAITARSGALAAERLGIQLQGARLARTLDLIRALGGGWDVATALKSKP